jgi:hypothetical protein
MHASVAEIEAGAENFGSFIAPDFKHCIIPYDEFYSVSVGETSLIEVDHRVSGWPGDRERQVRGRRVRGAGALAVC